MNQKTYNDVISGKSDNNINLVISAILLLI
ncbi:hypothetical protein C823_007913 [Eubacterium plexicaudatum ASF492]|nr:hypothetical protein C823_007913 [Eubacterium plexicaudatum ASF492]